ncbi:hypothetical protein BJX63DRAFT_382138 [Aspergillus granulosus]|uniref:Uncharacterized protein n=1 Tax=Aspergillus granulosus TaxID=176169 RepID=A0ABR4HVF2_9EURO
MCQTCPWSIPSPTDIPDTRFPDTMHTPAIMPPSRTSTPPSVALLSAKSPEKGFGLPSFTAPPGWTASPSSPVYYEEWDGADSEGQTIARRYGLQPGQPVMEDNEAWTTIFQSGDKFYIWERIGDEVCEIISRDIREIAFVMSQSELRELATKPLIQIE